MGPVTLALGPYIFTAMGFGYQEIDRELSTPWASNDVVDRMEALQWMGPTSDEVNIRGVLFPLEFGGMGTLDGLRSAALAGKPLMFASLAGRIYGRHALVRVGEERSHHIAAGTPGRLGYRLELRRHDASGISAGVSIRLF